MGSIRNFAIFFVGVMVVMAGMVAWYNFRDYDQHYYFKETHDEFPRNAGDLGYYEDMSPGQQQIVDGALHGQRYEFSEDATVPPPVVKKDGKYQEFVYFETFDWSDPKMVLTTLIILVGGLITLEGIRREQFPNTDLADVKYHMPFIGGR